MILQVLIYTLRQGSLSPVNDPRCLKQVHHLGRGQAEPVREVKEGALGPCGHPSPPLWPPDRRTTTEGGVYGASMG